MLGCTFTRWVISCSASSRVRDFRLRTMYSGCSKGEIFIRLWPIHEDVSLRFCTAASKSPCGLQRFGTAPLTRRSRPTISQKKPARFPTPEPRNCRTAPETGIVRSRALQRGRGTVPPCPQIRAEALDYEPHVRKVHGSNAQRKQCGGYP